MLLAATGTFGREPGSGFSGRPAFHIYTDRDGLPQNVVECIAFDRSGFLWVGTQNGAAYYNGRSWTTVNMPARNTSNYVFAILAASDGSIWFGTQQAGLCRLKDGKWDTFSTANSGLPNNEVRCLLEMPGSSSDPAIWAGTGGGGVAVYQAGRWTKFNTANAALRSDNVRCIATTVSQTGTQSVWIGTLGGGLSRYCNGRWQGFDAANSGLPKNDVRCLAALPARVDGNEDELWIGTTGGGVAHYKSGAWTRIDAASAGLQIDMVRSLEVTTSVSGDPVVWIGTNFNGLARVEAGKGTLYNTSNSDLPNNSVLSLRGDPQSKSLWIGTLDGGLGHYTPGGWNTLDQRNSGLPDKQVWSIAETQGSRTGSAYWFGTTNGLARFTDGKWVVYNSRNSGLPRDFILSLLDSGNAGRNRLLVGTNGGGLAQFEAGKWTVLGKTDPGLPGNVIICLLETGSGDRARTLWAGTESRGLAFCRNGVWSAFDTSNSGLPDNKVLSLMETVSATGTPVLWVGTNAGLARYSEGKWRKFRAANSRLPNDQVWGLTQTTGAEGQHWIWAGTVGGGVARFDPESPDGNWLVLSETSSPALPNNSVWQIREDPAGHIYIFTDKGVARLTPRSPTAQDPSEYTLYTFIAADGLPSNGCNQGASMVDSAGRIWTGTGAGAAVFDPRTYVEDCNAKPLYLGEVLVNGKKRLLGSREALAYSENNLRFEYALLNYFREGSTEYRFQLDGFDAQPSEWTPEPKKEYTNLGEGRYEFRVWARDYAGNISGPVGAAFGIRAAPWRTWPAYGLYSLLMLAAVAATDRVQRRRLIRKERDRAHLRETELRAEAAEAQARAVEAENRRKSEELDFARQLQLSMLPKQDVVFERGEIVGRMRTATEVGGDYYDFIKVDDGRYCVAIGDATGHGVGAGLVVGMVKTALLNSVLRWSPESGVRQLMIDLNATFKASLSHRGVGMCFGIAVIDLTGMTVELCSSGMPFPYIYEAKTGSVRTMQLPGPPIGFMKKIEPRTEGMTLGPADRLVLMSDGFHERMNAEGRTWGYDTVTGELARACSEEPSASGIAERMFTASDRFARQHEPEDDMTIVVIASKPDA